MVLFASLHSPKQTRTVRGVNALLVIAPYKYQGAWVFDDPAVGLSREPFIAEIGTMRSSLGCSFRAINGHRRSNFSVFATTPAVAYLCLVRCCFCARTFGPASL